MGQVSTAGDVQLVIAALAGIAAIVILISLAKLHPFLSLAIGSLVVGVLANLGPTGSVASFSKGFGATMAGVGILVALGAMFGKLLADSGAADRIVDTLVGRSNPATLPWTMGLVGAIIGLPMFFEIGLVLLIPVIILVSQRSGQSVIRIAIPTLAGLSAMHGLVPPHPGPLVAISALGANLGLTLAFGVLIAIPTVIISGPLFAIVAARNVPLETPRLFGAAKDANEKRTQYENQPSFRASITAILLPVALMLARAISEIVAPGSKALLPSALHVLGDPMIALGITVLAGVWLFRMNRVDMSHSLEGSLAPIAGILLIVGAGGGFKQVLVDTGIGNVIANLIAHSSLPVMFLAWLVAVLVRVATGSATVATVTAAGILAPVAAHLPPAQGALMVLAIGSGSLFLSHLNDAGFWLVKSYFNMDIGQTLKTWTAMECLISVCGLAGVLILGLFV
jgi:GntP family gluconate:H+ symporter